jgi:hypothetical protein
MVLQTALAVEIEASASKQFDLSGQNLHRSSSLTLNTNTIDCFGVGF